MKNYIAQKIEEFEEECYGGYSDGTKDFFIRALTDLLDKVQEELPAKKEMPPHKVTGNMSEDLLHHREMAKVAGFNEYRETIINKLDNLRK